MEHTLSGKSIVITGASGKVGRASAILLASKGANLVLAGRDDIKLEDLAMTCEKYGVKAYPYKTDVMRLDQVRNLLEFALSQYGSIDIWINCASLTAIGEFTKMSFETQEQVLKTNLLGHMHAAYTVIPYFKDQRKGTMINNVTIGAFVPTPYAAAYSASKFALRGFYEALKFEIEDYENIHICEVFPSNANSRDILSSLDESRSAPLVYDPKKAAISIIALCQNPKDHSMVDNSARVARIVYALTPKFMGHLVARFMKKKAHENPIEVKSIRKSWKESDIHRLWQKSESSKQDLKH